MVQIANPEWTGGGRIVCSDGLRINSDITVYERIDGLMHKWLEWNGCCC
jgi:hypothetical protein